MGLLSFLSGKTHLFSYEINMNLDNTLCVKVNPLIPGLSNHEYLRLWAFYQCKVMYNLGYPNNSTANYLRIILQKIISRKFDINTDCFERVNLSDVISYSDQCMNPKISLTGEFYAKDSSNRLINTNFPLKITEQQVLYSSIGLLQYAINRCLKAQDELDIARKIIYFLLMGFDSGNTDLRSMTSLIPEKSYTYALSTDAKELFNDDVEDDKFLGAYREVSKSDNLSDMAKQYRSKKYPLDSFNIMNKYFGSFFIIGYNIRLAEEIYADNTVLPVLDVKNNKETQVFLETTNTMEQKIELIAEYKETNNDKCGLGQEVEPYSFLGLDLLNEYFSFLLHDFIKSVEFIERTGLTQDQAIEVSGRNTALGYCYRLAEEIVDNYHLLNDNKELTSDFFGSEDISDITFNIEAISQGTFDIVPLETDTDLPSSMSIEDWFLDVYSRVTKYPELSYLAKEYRASLYPLNDEIYPSKNSFNGSVGGAFTVGYNIRVAESKFNSAYNYDPNAIKHNLETLNILNSDASISKKIKEIAEFKENNNTTICLSSEVSNYSVIGFEQTKELFISIVNDFLQTNIDVISSKVNLTKEVAREIVFRNASLGYCYKLSEEIVSTYLKKNLNVI